MSQAREETVRRTNLYGVSSQKRLPQVHLEPSDARVRKDLQILTHRVHLNNLHADHDQQRHAYENELNDRKHREDAGLRPPLDRIQGLQDLCTTVPKDLRLTSNQHDTSDSIKKLVQHRREWRVGYANNPHGDRRGPLSGMFEPSDSVRETVVGASGDRIGAAHLSAVVAYPLLPISASKIEADMQPYDDDAAREAMERKISIHRRNQDDEDDPLTPWCPASYATLHEAHHSDSNTKGGSLAMNPKCAQQTFPVRRVVTSTEKSASSRKTPLSVDERCVKKKQTLVAKAVESYSRLRQRLDRSKDPKLRYTLPVEDPSCVHAYRLGLEPVPSTFEASISATGGADSSAISSISSPPERLRFRPRTAAGNIPFRSNSSASLHTMTNSSSSRCLQPGASVGKVAGAKRRPHSASVCYLGSSTVYCVDAPAVGSSKYTSRLQESQRLPAGDGADFSSVLDKERGKRERNQEQTLAMLSKRGMFHNLPVPQIFARLRRESLKNLTGRLQYAKYEKMSMVEYMTSCGMQTIVNHKNAPNSKSDVEIAFDTDPSAPHTDATRSDNASKQEEVGDETSKTITFAAASNTSGRSSTTNPSSLLEMRKMLFVTRQQFHIALEAFNLSPSDVNLLFSSLDVAVADHVPLWEIMCTVEKLQDGHAQLRRSRIQVKARDLPKDLEVLRSSFSIPQLTHMPLAVSGGAPEFDAIDEDM